MATLVMPQIEPQRRMSRERDTTPQEIIASARSAPAPMRGALIASVATSVLMWMAFTPVDFGPLGWVCLLPLLMLVPIARPTQGMYRGLYLGGLCFWVPALQWMRLGDPTMYVAWLALAAYLAVYFPLFIGLTRLAVHRCHVPFVLAAPVAWVGLEWVRSHLLTGFPWYFLAHSQHNWIEMIQVSDLVGAYGVSFVMVACSAGAVSVMPHSWFARLRLLPASDTVQPESARTSAALWPVAACLTMLAATLGYGFWRRSTADFQAGPRVALIQGNFVSSARAEPELGKMYKRHRYLTSRSVLEHPDWIIWPESSFDVPLFQAAPGTTAEDAASIHPELAKRLEDKSVKTMLNNLSQMGNAAVVVGLTTLEVDQKELRTFNSAALVRPDAGLTARYDKLHRVIFGEYIPLVEYFPALQSFTPYRGDFGIQRGRGPVVFEYQGVRCTPVICYEDTKPDVVRDVINATAATPQGRKEVDFLVNLTNDGWFHGSSELDQHLITAAFRCVECRVPMVRAVNTGISAFIDGDGVVCKRAIDIATGKSKEVEAVVVDAVPLDARSSFYLAWGDWFAATCALFCGVLAAVGLLSRWLPRWNTLVAGA